MAVLAIAIAAAGLARPAAAEVGALAYSPATDQVVVLSLNIFTLREVQMQALERCTEDDCRILATFRAGECVAVASSDKRYGMGKGQSQQEADAAAMDSCSDGGADPNCRLLGQLCAKE
jgi:hypothetical protein